MDRYDEWGMANIPGEDTGLGKIVVFVNTGEKAKHGCRIKVSNIPGKFSPTDTFSVDMNGKIVAGKNKLDAFAFHKILLWMKLNEDLILEYWKGDLSTKVMLERVQKIEEKDEQN